MTPYFETDLGKLYHGDCLEIMTQLEPVDLVLTDPPYGMNNNVDTTRFSGGSASSKARRGIGISGRDRIYGDDEPFNPSPFLGFDNVILWGYTHFAYSLPTGTNLVWLKRFDSAFGTFLSDAEIAWMKGGCGVYCFRDLSMMAVKNRLHPNQKPLPLMQWCICKSKTDGIILDPFVGSGSTIIACQRLNRRWIGIEISEKYCEIAAKRIEQETRQRRMF